MPAKTLRVFPVPRITNSRRARAQETLAIFFGGRCLCKMESQNQSKTQENGRKIIASTFLGLEARMEIRELTEMLGHRNGPEKRRQSTEPQARRLD